MAKLTDWLYPYIRCVACAREAPLSAEHLCADCIEALSGLYSDALPEGVWSGYVYEGVARELVHRLKFGNIHGAARPLAERMSIAGERLWESDCDALVPVPLSKKRERERGYNQSALLCAELSRITGLPVLDKRCLLRTRNTATQTRLSLLDRHTNVFEAFAAARVKGLRLILVDDVYTTGATAKDCARALKAAGAEHVHVLCATIAKEHGRADKQNEGQAE